ncbi:hypothetical protein [Catellatospora sichuanensis]|uniref:hypothetical protein n=1 Tax=Catellatospora sichuanensis TaxID=1969805 RepID=UPI00118234D6|nr:hypothetical protein [Catellatospora sichuanensis]
MPPEDETHSAGWPPPADRRSPDETGTGAVDPWARSAPELLPLDEEDPTPAAVIAAAHSAAPPDDEQPTAPLAGYAPPQVEPPTLPLAAYAPPAEVTFVQPATPMPPVSSVPGGYPPPGSSAPGGYPVSATPGGYPVSATPGGYPVSATPGGYPVSATPGGYPVSGMPGGGHQARPVSGMPGYPVSGIPGGYPPFPASGVPGGHPAGWPQGGPPPRPRRRWGRLLAIVAVVVLVFCLVAGGLAVLAFPWLKNRLDGAAPTGAPSPGPNAPFAARQAWIKDRIGAALTEQHRALLAGDEAAYLSVVDTAAPQVLDGMRTQFRSLRAMRVAQWSDEPSNPTPVAAEGGEQWSTELRGTPCFVTPTCAKAGARAQTRWRIRDGRAWLIEWRPVAAQPSPHPWQVAELVADAGERTVVATTPDYAGELPTLLAEAEKAARVADRFARAGAVPARYVVYYAGSDEWRRWFTWNPGDTVSGVALRVSVERWELMLYDDNITPEVLGGVLRHELTHASSLAGPFKDSDSMWWLHEGLAEYALMDGARVRDYLRMPAIRQLVEDGWNGDVEFTDPPKGTKGWIVSARYGMSALAVRHLADRFGEDRLVEFFHRVVHDGVTVPVAARETLGVEWAVLERECADFIRHSVA